MVERDMRAIHAIDPLPVPLWMLCGPGLYQPTREKKLRAGKASVEALPHVLPQDQWASTFHIWHDDLHTENIFVDPDKPSEILSIIDWQSTSVVPLFDHAISPGYLDYDGPAVDGIGKPVFPELPEDTTAEEEAEAEKLFEAQTLACGYKLLLRKHIEPVFEALMYRESDDSSVMTTSRRLLDAGEAHCMAAIAALELPDMRFSEAELAEIKEDVAKTSASIQAMEAIKRTAGPLFPEKGIVTHEQYDDAKAALRNYKEQVMEKFSKTDEDRVAWEKAWPFDD